MSLTTFATAAALLTPVATPANMMVIGPAAIASAITGSSGCVLLLFFVVSVFFVPLFWTF